MADFLTTDFFLLSGVTFDGTTVSWESAISYFGNITIFDIGDSSPPPQDGNDSLLWYNGYTVNIAGYDYKLFQATGSSYAYIPYDIYVNDMSSFPPGPGSTSTYQPALTTAANCFLTGTRIATPASDVFVENLIIGDLVLTADGRAVPVRWLARQTIANFPFALSPKLEPVLISAGALGNGLPLTDLTVSADHGMILDGLVVNSSAMVNGSTIRFVPLADMPATITWWHIETAEHDVLLANGAPTESFIDYTGRKAFDNYAEYLKLYGADRLIREMPTPRISARRQLPPALRERLGIAPATPEMSEIAHLLASRAG